MSKCLVCLKAVYPNDPQIKVDGSLYHHSCAKCEDCGKDSTIFPLPKFLFTSLGCQITVANFTRVDGHLLCRIHYMKKVMEAGGKHGGDERFRTNNEKFKQYVTKNVEKQTDPPEMNSTSTLIMKTELHDASTENINEIESRSNNEDRDTEIPPESSPQGPKASLPTVETLLQELEALRLELANERERRRALDEECDSLAMANCLLTEELNALRRRSSVLSHRRGSATQSEEVVISAGDGNFAKVEKLKIANAAGGSNVLSVCFLEITPEEQVIVCGGADKIVFGYTKSGEQLFQHELSAPVLSLASHEGLLAISCMDGSHAILNAANQQLQTFHEHSKYIVFIRWSTSGRFLATACYDKSVRIYSIR